MHLTVENLEMNDPSYLPASPCSNCMLPHNTNFLPIGIKVWQHGSGNGLPLCSAKLGPDNKYFPTTDASWPSSQQRMLPDQECFLTTNASWQRMFPDHGCFLTTDVSWQGMFPDNGCFLTTDVSWQRMFPDNWCFLTTDVSWQQMFHVIYSLQRNV